MIAVATCGVATVGVDVERLPDANVDSEGMNDWVEREARFKAGLLSGEGAEMTGGSFLAVACPLAGYIAGLAVAASGVMVAIDLIEHPFVHKLP
ncbi:MAG: hypothetical protein ABIS84_02290 [Arachnia sp.]